MAEEATVDCNDESDQLMGWFTMIEENLECPFETVVLGIPVTVERVSQRDDGLFAICIRSRHRQAIALLDLPLPSPPPKGAAWIDAYRWWRRGG